MAGVSEILSVCARPEARQYVAASAQWLRNVREDLREHAPLTTGHGKGKVQRYSPFKNCKIALRVYLIPKRLQAPRIA